VVPSEPKEAEGERDHSSAALASVRPPSPIAQIMFFASSFSYSTANFDYA
jgi:hypothetical protein